MDSFDSLPDEILVEIFKWISGRDLVATGCLNRKFKQIVDIVIADKIREVRKLLNEDCYAYKYIFQDSDLTVSVSFLVLYIINTDLVDISQTFGGMEESERKKYPWILEAKPLSAYNFTHNMSRHSTVEKSSKELDKLAEYLIKNKYTIRNIQNEFLIL